MHLRKILAGTAIAATMTLGVAGVAGAQTTDTTGPSTSTPAAATTPTHHIDCAKVEQVIARLHERDAAVNARLVKAEARVDQLRQEGKTARADALAKRIELIKARLTTVEARLAKVEARVDTVCNLTPSSGGSGGTSTGQVPTTPTV